MSGSTRREFLGRAAVLGAAGVLGAGMTAAEADPVAANPAKSVGGRTRAAKSKRRALSANDRIRCGYIGVGGRGSSLLQSTLTLDGVDVVAVADTYDVWRDRAVGWCKVKQPSVRGYVRFEEMIEKEPLDAVVIATPDHIHEPAILAALDRGLDVYTEKPMTLTWEAAKTVRDRVAETGAVLQVGTQLRSMAMYQKARELAHSGALGTLALVQINRHSSESCLQEVLTPKDASAKNVHWALFLRDTKDYPFDPLRYFHWRQFVEYSNGYFGDLMLHHVDICHFITGCGMPRRVKAVGGVYVLKDGRTCPDTVSALLEYGEGFHVNYTTTAANDHYGLVERYLFSKGTIEVRGMNEMTVFRDEIEEMVPSAGILNEPHLQNFFDCMRSREKPLAPVEAGLVGAVCTRMAFESMQQGAASVWDPDTETVSV
jgi:predicted dehydrogenase